jgi:hypothetical protein
MSRRNLDLVLGSIAVLLSSLGGPFEMGLKRNNFKEITVKMSTTVSTTETHQQYFFALAHGSFG